MNTRVTEKMVNVCLAKNGHIDTFIYVYVFNMLFSTPLFNTVNC